MNSHCDVAVIGAGMGGLAAAALLARRGLNVTLFEQNRFPGGCASSFYRQGYWFETGATTLVGLDDGLPLAKLRDELQLEFTAEPLEIPMQIHFTDGETLTRYSDPEAWIREAERVFGAEGQREFWTECQRASDFVWRTALAQTTFPPGAWRDWLRCVQRLRFEQIRYAPRALGVLADTLRRRGLLSNRRFVEFINEQLLITAQNTIEEVNPLFGSAALCYANLTNYYIPGGFLQLARAFETRLKTDGAEIRYRSAVESIAPLNNGGFRVRSSRGETMASAVISGVPLQNTLRLLGNAALSRRYAPRIPPSERLWSAFTLGLAFVRTRKYDALHHQIHLPEPLPDLGARSLFVSLSHPDDAQRAPRDVVVVSVSTHAPDPAQRQTLDVAAIQAAMLDALYARGLFRPADLLYSHVSTPRTWLEWTGREHGSVGGFPQFASVKPWRMIESRIRPGVYQCGDTSYPGQGVPAAALSGMIAVEKLLSDRPDLRRRMRTPSIPFASPSHAASTERDHASIL